MNFTTVSGSEISQTWNCATVSDAVIAPEFWESLRQLDDPAMNSTTVSGSATTLPGILRESQALRRCCHQLYDSLRLWDDFTLNSATVSGSATTATINSSTVSGSAHTNALILRLSSLRGGPRGLRGCYEMLRLCAHTR